jgi:hypothetical protein
MIDDFALIYCKMGHNGGRSAIAMAAVADAPRSVSGFRYQVSGVSFQGSSHNLDQATPET